VPVALHTVDAKHDFSMTPLVSIIIPCFNAERWVGEAIRSALGQSHRPLEVIVIDDGSTDQSLEVIKSFGDKIRWETGPNRGGNAARNRGLALSSGKYLQFLDADDYLLPEKIARQVAFLESTAADVVYGDWRHQHHLPDSKVELENIAISGEHDDILCELLGGWWVAPAAVLARREAILKTEGWDESLKAAQDRDYMISVAMTGARIAYQPGCYSIYRRYGEVTVSTGNWQRWLENHTRVLDKSLGALQSAGRLAARYRKALARSYFTLAQNYYDRDRNAFERLIVKVVSLEPNFTVSHSRLYALAQKVLGLRRAEALASWKRRAGRLTSSVSLR
jgi:glycosyltransferase involved in cell wall biosynthesis